MLTQAAILLLLAKVLATPVGEIEERQSCPGIHVFGARETTVSPGYGTAATVVNLVLNSHSGSTAEAISYPACGGQSSCGGVSYANSVAQGVAAVASQVNAFNQKCPSTQLVLVGYSQGGQIFDDAFCGGGDPNNGVSSTAVQISAAAVQMVKAAIFMGDPRYIAGLPYNVGTCTAQGFAPRPAGFSCPSASKIKSYCDSTDPYCCNGNDANSHQQYGNKYGQQALSFINSQLSASGGGNTGGGGSTPTTTASGGTPTGGGGGGGSTNCSAKWGQCGGSGWTGGTCCASGSTCTYNNQWYSQCL